MIKRSAVSRQPASAGEAFRYPVTANPSSVSALDRLPPTKVVVDDQNILPVRYMRVSGRLQRAWECCLYIDQSKSIRQPFQKFYSLIYRVAQVTTVEYKSALAHIHYAENLRF
jgi:hypothetical protein